ncbi:nickel-type superoxide dismutase maturation protease [Candidatus Daviesbacteria bacterium]|nr:nickel-type superoxide dismutase maturation protease [Candidatus Daviesbacteria bacterium]
MIFPLKRFTASGNSMLPTLKDGQDILVWCWFVNPKVGDIVVIKHKGKEIVKRIENIQNNTVFVTGDNKQESTDSRNFGAVSRLEIVGKVVYVR